MFLSNFKTRFRLPAELGINETGLEATPKAYLQKKDAPGLKCSWGGFTKGCAMKLTNFSNKNISSSLIEEITSALKSIRSFGSVEIYIQKGIVTQITVRNIKKTNSKIK